MDRKDPNGFYAILQVAPTASAALIKAAYRHRAMELHPDRNKSSTATADFQLLTLAYSQLSDPKARAAYDAQSAVGEQGRTPHASKSEAPPSYEPVMCSVCGKVSAQPRYVVFWEVKSFILMTQRSPIQGIYCPACAEKRAFRASAVTWLLGWWGFPWGPLYSVGALFGNLLGGEKPALGNAKILAYQCFVFGLRGQPQVAVGIAREAMKFALKIPLSEPTRESIIADLQKVLQAAEPRTPALINGWRLWNRPFHVQGAAMIIVGALLTIWIYQANSGDSVNNLAVAPTTRVVSTRSPTAPATRKPQYIRPANAPNGAPWPTTAGYVDGYKKRYMKGLSTITIDNTQSDSDVFVKLISLNAGTASSARVIFIPAFGQFTATKLTKGTYRVEYEDLSTGRKYRGDTFQAEETRVPGGIEYSEDSLTLYKVMNGNVNLAEIDDADFENGLEDDTDTGDKLAQQ